MGLLEKANLLCTRINEIYSASFELNKNLLSQGLYDKSLNDIFKRAYKTKNEIASIVEKLNLISVDNEFDNLSISADDIKNIANNIDIEIIEIISYPQRMARYSAIPTELHPLIKNRIQEDYPKGLYAHQSKSITSGLSGHNICVATPTASGKTLIFTSIAISYLLFNKTAKIIAFYPVKALLHDQALKWQKAIKDTGLHIEIIDGGVNTAERFFRLEKAQILLMTPDVLHAWLMSNIDKKEIRSFLISLDMIILDEAHIYNGVFGTNMAYLLRRLRAVSGVKNFLASSATIDDPIGFLQQLTGLSFELIGKEDDSAAIPKKDIMLCRMIKYQATDFFKELIQLITQNKRTGKFLIFLDSRKRVEELAAASHSWHKNEELSEDNEVLKTFDDKSILPYRAGYESEDRKVIQDTLTKGNLSGVITTSALELGIDIGDIELVVMLGEPPSIKSFWQRAGRAGRLKQGVIVLLDINGRITSMGLSNYLNHLPEPNWIYLNNEYLQYVNALCATDELRKIPKLLYSKTPFDTLPPTFLELIDNEIEPTRPIPNELYELKQRANNKNPHHEFPLRNSIEINYKVTYEWGGKYLGDLTYTQVLREAFAGAIYRYMTNPYRIHKIKQQPKKEIIAEREKGIFHKITKPITQTMVFPRFDDSLYFISQSKTAFIAECRVQVSERVMGFKESDRYGRNEVEVIYGAGNPYSQKPLINIINTTGVCFYFPEEYLQREILGANIAIAFCRVCSILKNEIGYGTFVSQISPLNNGKIKGFAIYDAVQGSLRLTKQIPERLEEVLDETIRSLKEYIVEDDDSQFIDDMKELVANIEEIISFTKLFSQSKQYDISTEIFTKEASHDWVTVISANQSALYHDGISHINEEVIVLNYIYTPNGIKYSLKTKDNKGSWQVSDKHIKPILGVTTQELYNINTGEIKGNCHDRY